MKRKSNKKYSKGNPRLKYKVRPIIIEPHELQLILENREKALRDKEKNFFKRYLFNKHVWFVIQTQVLRESIRTMFVVYLIEKLKNN